jgi:hypothetical protein
MAELHSLSGAGAEAPTGLPINRFRSFEAPMSESQALAIVSPTTSASSAPAPRRNASGRRPHAGARNFRFPNARGNKGAKLGESAEDKALIEAFIRDKGVSVQKPGYAWGAKAMPTYDSFSPPSY